MRLLSILLLFLVAAPAWATTVRAMDLPALVRQADAVVVGRVLSQECLWQGPHIVTVHRFALETQWTGVPLTTPTLDVVTLGGRVGDLGQEMGDPRLPLGDRLVLHLRRAPGREYRLVGLGQGVWHVGEPQAAGTAIRHAVGPGADSLEALAQQVRDIDDAL